MFNLFCAERTWGHSRFFVQCLLSSKALPTATQHGLSPQLCSRSKAWLGNLGSTVSGMGSHGDRAVWEQLVRCGGHAAQE